MDSPLQGSLILCKVFLVVCLLFYYYFCFVGWFGALDFFWLVLFVCFEKRKIERRKIKEFGQEHMKKTALLLNGVNTDLLAWADGLQYKLTLC